MPPVNTEGKYFQSIAMVDEIVDHLEGVLNDLKPTVQDNRYVVFAVRDLAWIALSLISSISRNLHWRYNAYTAASMTRLLLECVTEIKYIKSHPKKAKPFWENQQKIKKTFQNIDEEDKWALFSDGTLSKYGQLSGSTMSRVSKVLGSDGLERYGFLCFYSHPNIAGYAWVSHDQTQPGIIVKFAAETFFKMTDTILHEISALESQTINLDNLISKTQKAYQQYLSECEE